MDHYLLSSDNISPAPTSFRGRLKHLGPSLILSASIVGSGELIATTSLGAKAGFITFWLILIGCLIKVMVQIAYGKQTILSGKTSMQLFGEIPGPRKGNVNWALVLMALLMLLKFFQMGGVIGSVAIILQMAAPALPLPVFLLALIIITGALIGKAYYKYVERGSLYMIGIFTILAFSSLFFLKFTPYALHFDQIAEGLQFKLPKSALAFAFGAFGITGVGGDEIIHYNYWCLEKGYATYSGPNDGSHAWQKNAKGWLAVMRLDAVIALLIYTSVTAVFYLLGAAILHGKGEIPEGFEMINSLSAIFTETLGPGAKLIFLIGAFVVLFSTLYASAAAWTRQYADLFGRFGWIDFFDKEQRDRTIRFMAYALPSIWSILFLYFKTPVLMVLVGGIVGSFILFLVVIAVLYFRYFTTPEAFKPRFWNDSLLWISCLSILAIGTYGLIQLF